MNKEYDLNLEKLVMRNHWNIVENKPYPKFKGVWEMRHFLPVTHIKVFEKETGEQPIEIPFISGGYIRLGRTTEQDAPISAYLKYPTARGDTDMREDGFIITDILNNKPYSFWIFYDDHDEDERMKFLSRFDPERDIDWEKIKPGTIKYMIAKAFCKYKDVESEPKE